MSVFQDLFTAALMDPVHAIPDGLTDAENRPAGRRFDVYRNNVAVSLTEALHTAFPVIAKLLGKQNMDGLAGVFLRKHPPLSPLLMFYGEAFPDFLAGIEQLNHIGYLADVARLELALRHAYHAADATPIKAEALAQLAPEDLMTTTVTLAPAMQVLTSDWPIFDIWQYNTQDGADKPRAQAQDVLITRPEYDPLPQLLPPGGAAWIQALQAGQTIGEAHDTALTANPDFDLGATLALLLQGGALTTLNTKG
ncbi:MAG: DUF2063 domain-containing protein [Rhodobacteraceae bacterium]|nr:DUF2063 domain-containing protein [Paracoccaceae bacterium]